MINDDPDHPCDETVIEEKVGTLCSYYRSSWKAPCASIVYMNMTDDVAEKLGRKNTFTQSSIPGPDALPAEIREFLTYTLYDSRGLSLEHARLIAQKWTIGTGRELRIYPPKIFLDIFGWEDGWCLYKDVKTKLLEETHPRPTSPGNRALGLFICLLCILATYSSISMVSSPSHPLLHRGLAVLVLPLLISGGLAFWSSAIAPSLTVEEIIEKELASVFDKDQKRDSKKHGPT